MTDREAFIDWGHKCKACHNGTRLRADRQLREVPPATEHRHVGLRLRGQVRRQAIAPGADPVASHDPLGFPMHAAELSAIVLSEFRVRSE